MLKLVCSLYICVMNIQFKLSEVLPATVNVLNQNTTPTVTSTTLAESLSGHTGHLIHVYNCKDTKQDVS